MNSFLTAMKTDIKKKSLYRDKVKRSNKCYSIPEGGYVSMFSLNGGHTVCHRATVGNTTSALATWKHKHNIKTTKYIVLCRLGVQDPKRFEELMQWFISEFQKATRINEYRQYTVVHWHGVCVCVCPLTCLQSTLAACWKWQKKEKNQTTLNVQVKSSYKQNW